MAYDMVVGTVIDGYIVLTLKRVRGIGHKCVLEFVFFLLPITGELLSFVMVELVEIGGYDGAVLKVVCSVLRMEFLCEHLPVCSSLGFT